MKRVPIIDFVRFGSFFVVLGEHFFPAWLCRSIPNPFLQSLVLNAFHHGTYGVVCFFVVSGYLITQMLAKGQTDLSGIELRSFYVKRAARIWPLLVLVALAGFGLEQGKGLLDPRVQTYHVWNDETGFGGLFWFCLGTFSFNWYLINHYLIEGFQWNIFWSLAVEEQFYAGYPLALKILRHRRRIYSFLALVVLSGWAFRWFVFLRWGPAPGGVPTPFFSVLEQMASFSNFDHIAVGAALYFLQERSSRWMKAHRKTALGCFLAGSVSCFYLCAGGDWHSIWGAVAVPGLMALSCALLLWGGLNLPFLDSRAAHIFSNPGRLSYGCYLWHPTVTFLLMPGLMTIGGLGSFAALLLGVIVFAYLSYRYFETPVNAWIRHWFGLKPSTTL